jgi:hypothetical protein
MFETWGPPEIAALRTVLLGNLRWWEAMKYLQNLEISPGDTTFAEDIANNVGLVYPELMELFRELYKIGVGWFAVGRRGKRTRFVWRYAPHQVIALIKSSPSETKIPIAPDEEQVEAAQEEVEEGVQASEEQTFEHIFRLRNYLSVTLQLPADLTKSEAARLARFVTSLPFEP